LRLHVSLTEPGPVEKPDAQRKHIAARVPKLPIKNVLRIAATGKVMAAIPTTMHAELACPMLRDGVIAHLTIADGPGPLLS
jgi:hypothetical protein